MNTKQFPPVDLRAGEALREGAADVLTRATTRHGKRYAPLVNPTALSRSRRGDVSNPVYRVAVLLAAMRKAGEPAEHAYLLLTWLQSVADELWGADLRDLESAIRAEAEKDAAEDAAGMESVMTGDYGGWIPALEMQLATGRTLLGRLRWAMSHARRIA